MFLGPPPRSLGLRIAAPLVAVEGAVLTVYGVYLLVEALRQGVTGPAEVSNVPAVVLEIVIFTGFGVALLATARGLWRTWRGARAPAVLAQLIAIVVGGPLVFASEAASRVAGIAIVVTAVATTVAIFGRGVTHDLVAP